MLVLVRALVLDGSRAGYVAEHEHEHESMDMFGVSPLEILLIAVVALLVYGRDLPQATRKLGRVMGDLRRNLDKVKEEIQKEIPKIDMTADESAGKTPESRGGEEANLPVSTGSEVIPAGETAAKSGEAPAGGPDARPQEETAAKPPVGGGTEGAASGGPATPPATEPPSPPAAQAPPPEAYPRSSDDRDRPAGL